MSQQDYDICVKIGAKKDGKPIFKKVGSLRSSDKGPYILLDKTFNPAGVMDDKGHTSAMLSCFIPRPKTSQPNDYQQDSHGQSPFDDSEPLPF